MNVQGKAWKDGKHWLIQVPLLEIFTECFKKSDVLEYICEAIELLEPGIECEAQWTGKDSFAVTAENTGRFRSFVLKRVRFKAELTQGELAARLGQRNHSTISAYESGAKHPSLETFLRYIRTMGVDVVLQLTLNKT